jgi:DeoR family fructose operon transcriptional repressor
MSKQARWNKIIQLCQAQEEVSVDELVKTLGVSPATVRRDLQEMDDLNMIIRRRGGARLVSTQLIEPNMKIKSASHHAEKQQIGYIAAQQVEDNQMIYIDSGSTTFEMLQYIQAKNVTVVTPGIPHLQVLGQRRISTIVLGGRLHWSSESIVGMRAIKMLKEMYFDVSFLGVDGIHERLGFSTVNEAEASTKSLGIRHARKAFILTDHTKFNLLGAVPFANLDEATVITDSVDNFDKNLIKYITTSGDTNV